MRQEHRSGPNLMKLPQKHSKQLHFEIIEELRLKSKMAADGVIRNFKIRILLATFCNLCLHTNLFQAFAGIPIFVVGKCCLPMVTLPTKNELISIVVLCQEFFKITKSEKTEGNSTSLILKYNKPWYYYCKIVKIKEC